MQATRYSVAMEAVRGKQPEAGEIGVCLGPRCGDYGGRVLLAALQARGVAAEAIDCQSLCPSSPVVRLKERCLHRATVEMVLAEVQPAGEEG